MRFFSAVGVFSLRPAFIAAFVVLVSQTLPARGNSITWSAATPISGDADVSTTGTLIGAFNLAGGASTVNSVNFAAFPISGASNSYTVGNFTLTDQSLDNIGAASTGTNQPLSVQYLALLNSAAVLNADNLITLDIAGLTVGQSYQFQAWTNNSARDSFSPDDFPTTISDTLGNEEEIYPGHINPPSRPGEFILGTFTATSTSRQITFLNGEIDGVLNAFQLRQLDVAPQIVPLPLAAWAGLTLLPAARLLRRRTCGQ